MDYVVIDIQLKYKKQNITDKISTKYEIVSVLSKELKVRDTIKFWDISVLVKVA